MLSARAVFGAGRALIWQIAPAAAQERVAQGPHPRYGTRPQRKAFRGDDAGGGFHAQLQAGGAAVDGAQESLVVPFEPPQSGHAFRGRRCDQTTDYRTGGRSEEHTSELQSRLHLVCRLLLEKKKKT